jgi:two-component system, chemotaxis family, response regulator PixG
LTGAPGDLILVSAYGGLVQTEDAATHRYRVMILDDSPVVLEAVSEALEAAGFEVTTWDNPFLAGHEIRRVKPDLVLVDHDMPGVMGAELIRILRGTTRRDLKIFLFSSYSEEKLKGFALASGASGFLCKTGNMDTLAVQVTAILEGKPW